MLGVLPPRSVFAMHGFGGCLEGWDDLLLASVREGGATVARDLAIGEGFFACFSEREQARPTQANVATPALDNDTQDLASGSRGIDDEIESIAIGIASGLAEGTHLQRGESFLRMAT